jgi:ABC-2 type transport system ATP-binding protein
LGGGIIKLVMKNPDPKKVEKLKYVKNVKVVDDGLLLTVIDGGKHLQEILKNVGDVDSVEIRPPTLNDVFLHYTGRSYRGDSPEGGVADRIMHFVSRR